MDPQPGRMTAALTCGWGEGGGGGAAPRDKFTRASFLPLTILEAAPSAASATHGSRAIISQHTNSRLKSPREAGSDRAATWRWRAAQDNTADGLVL